MPMRSPAAEEEDEEEEDSRHMAVITLAGLSGTSLLPGMRPRPCIAGRLASDATPSLDTTVELAKTSTIAKINDSGVGKSACVESK